MKTHYHSLIIGAGSAGLAARHEIAKTTDDYLVIESGDLGTMCARVGCMPSKILVEMASAHHGSAKLLAKGVISERPEINGKKLMQELRHLRDRFVKAVLTSMEPWQDLHLLKGFAKVIGPNRVQVGERIFTADHILLATGTRPIVPAGWADAGVPLVTTDEFFELEDLPARVGVIGAGPIGVELGQALSRLGVKVCLFGEPGSFGGVEDPEIEKEFRQFLGTEMSIHETKVTDLGKVAKENDLQLVIVAIGRRPDPEALGLTGWGIPLDRKGYPEIDPKTFQIKDTSLYLLGDANHRRPLYHEAIDQGKIAGSFVTRGSSKHFFENIALGIVFTSPQLARVGEGPRSLQAQGQEWIEGKVSFSGQGRALTKMENHGLLKLYANRQTGHLVGAEMWCPEAEHLAHLLAWVLPRKVTAAELLAQPFYHPTIQEGLRTALQDLAKKG